MIVRDKPNSGVLGLCALGKILLEAHACLFSNRRKPFEFFDTDHLLIMQHLQERVWIATATMDNEPGDAP